MPVAGVLARKERQREGWRKTGYGSGGPGHAGALFGAAMAGLSALLTVIVLVLRAFLGASATSSSAKSAEVPGQIAATGHEGRGRAAEVGAVAIERNAATHCLYVRLLQAGAGAVFAGEGAGVAGLNAALQVVSVHGGVLRDDCSALDR